MIFYGLPEAFRAGDGKIACVKGSLWIKITKKDEIASPSEQP